MWNEYDIAINGYIYLCFRFCKLPCTSNNGHKTWKHKLFGQFVSKAAEIFLQLANGSFVVWQQRETERKITWLSLISETTKKQTMPHRLHQTLQKKLYTMVQIWARLLHQQKWRIGVWCALILWHMANMMPDILHY